MVEGVSVIVCCYNSADRIQETLKFLLSQEPNEPLRWEVIVVNNASTDNTKQIVEEFNNCTSPKFSLRLIDESMAGLINARRKGIENATYDVIIFCDDDNHLAHNYVKQAFHIMQENPEIAIAGGWCKPKLPFYPGKWIEANYGALAIGARAEQSGYVDWVFGAGMIVRKQLFNELKSKNISLRLTGRLGGKQTSGDDAELCALARFIGYKIYYSSDLILYHQVSGSRLRKKNFLKVNTDNYLPVLHLYILEMVIADKNITLFRILSDFSFQRVKRIVVAIPRIIFGSRFLFNLVEIYGNILLLIWVTQSIPIIRKSFIEIQMDLYQTTKSET